MVQVIQANERPGFAGGLAKGLAKSLPEVLGKLGDEQTLKKREDRQLQQKLMLQDKQTELGKQRGAELSKSFLDMPETEIDPALKMVGKYIEQTGDFEGGMEVYKNMSAVRAAQAKANKPVGGVTAQPTPPQYADAIDSILQENPNATPDQLAVKFAKAGVPQTYTNQYVENRRREQERGATVSESRFKMHQPFIEETQQKYQGFETEMKPRLLQMQSMPEDKIVSAPAATFLESMGIPLGALENPESELYQKLSQDLLKGLPDTYGNRILKVEVDNFLKTIPTLMNSANGRRMIASNMLKLGEMKEVYYKEMRRLQKNYNSRNEALPMDFQQEVFDNVKPQIDRINQEFIKLAEVTDVPEGTVPFFDPQGNIKFVPKDKEKWATENGGRRIW